MTTLQSIENFQDIAVGDLVRVERGPLAYSTQIVRKIERTVNTFSPIMRWYGGPSLLFYFEDGGSAHHFQLDQSQPIQEKNWMRLPSVGQV